MHVALLWTWLGGFMTAWFGRDGQMPLQPGTEASSEMTESPLSISILFATVSVSFSFSVTCS